MQLFYRIFRERFRKTWMQTASAVIVALPFVIAISLLVKSWPLLSPAQLTNILFGSEWIPMQGKFGLWPFVSSSTIVSLIGVFLMIPVCLASAIYLTQFAPAWIANSLRSVIDILAGLPSVIFGLWGVVVVVPLIGDLAVAAGARNTSGYSVIAAGIVVSVSVAPFVLNMLVELLRSVSIDTKEAALSLGASHWQTIKDIILRKVRPGITAAFSLGFSKTFGETIAVLMVVGNVVQTPRSPFDAGYPLPALLANNYGEMMSIPMYDSALMFSALILLIIVTLFNYLSHKIISRYQPTM